MSIRAPILAAAGLACAAASAAAQTARFETLQQPLPASLRMTAAAPAPVRGETTQLSLEGRVLFCAKKRDAGGRAYRLDGWVWMHNPERGQEKGQLWVSFIPRFLICRPHPEAAGGYAWDNDQKAREELQLVAALYYRKGSLLGAPLTEAEGRILELPAGETRMTISYDFERFLNDKERAQLGAGAEVSKEFAFYPWPREKLNGRFGGMPSDLFNDGSWYTLLLSFKNDPSRRAVLTSSSLALARP